MMKHASEEELEDLGWKFNAHGVLVHAATLDAVVYGVTKPISSKNDSLKMYQNETQMYQSGPKMYQSEPQMYQNEPQMYQNKFQMNRNVPR